jgi:mRNA-degrading endonuclease RelE of RelBE toxin-antitoxin system
MIHAATSSFWKEYEKLPSAICKRADRQFSLLKANPQHPSLQFKKLGERQGQEIWSARVTLNYRALAIRRAEGYLWFWIGDHQTYESLLS